jgi:hypothetical protein
MLGMMMIFLNLQCKYANMQNRFFVAQHYIEYFGNAPKLKKHNLTKLHLINLSIKLSIAGIQ